MIEVIPVFTSKKLRRVCMVYAFGDIGSFPVLGLVRSRT